ncbi:MAG: hypothetical protein ABH816_01475 [Candidatus Levyibacteriota bacterium]
MEADYEFRKDYFAGDNHISLVLSWGTTEMNVDNCLTLGSTYSSSVDFWIGRGILEDRGNKFVPRIVSKNQHESIKHKLKQVKTNVIPFKNFSEIEVYEGMLNF